MYQGKTIGHVPLQCNVIFGHVLWLHHGIILSIYGVITWCFGVGHRIQCDFILHPCSAQLLPPPQRLLPLTHELSTSSVRTLIGLDGRKQPVCPMRETCVGRSTRRMWLSSTDAHVCPCSSHHQHSGRVNYITTRSHSVFTDRSDQQTTQHLILIK